MRGGEEIERMRNESESESDGGLHKERGEGDGRKVKGGKIFEGFHRVF